MEPNKEIVSTEIYEKNNLNSDLLKNEEEIQTKKRAKDEEKVTIQNKSEIVSINSRKDAGSITPNTINEAPQENISNLGDSGGVSQMETIRSKHIENSVDSMSTQNDLYDKTLKEHKVLSINESQIMELRNKHKFSSRLGCHCVLII